MSSSAATVSLVFKAQNLVGNAVSDVVNDVKKIGTAGKNAASAFTGAFRGMGGALSNAIGNATETLASGGSVTEAMAGMGIYMAGQLAESFGGQMIERLASSSLVAAVAAPMGALGTAIGGFISAAIPIGMALLPVLLIAAIVAAVVFLINNPDIVQKIASFVGDLVGHIGEFLSSGLAILLDILPKAFAAAWQLVVDGVGAYIGFLVDFWTKLPERLMGIGGAILDAIISGLSGLASSLFRIVGDAFRSLRLDIGPFHISASGVRVDLPHIDVPGFAAGVTGFAGGLAVVGEQGPELLNLPRGTDVIPNSRIPALAGGTPGGGASGVTIVGVSPADLERMIDARFMFRLARTPS